MLIEALFGFFALAGCDLTKAALGQCDVDCADSQAGSFTICASQGAGSGSTSPGRAQPSEPKPMRLCQYYVNGSIDQPTIGIITSWIVVGSRLCIGDAIPEPIEFTAPAVKSVQSQLSEQFGASTTKPFAWWEPGDELEVDELGQFFVSASEFQKSGLLFDESALIRFRPVQISWNFSDGVPGSGSGYQKSFSEIGTYQATASVDYQVDYKIGSGGWVSNAASWSLESNRLTVVVIDPPRRTLLVG
jgi:hypothetical protein